MSLSPEDAAERLASEVFRLFGRYAPTDAEGVRLQLPPPKNYRALRYYHELAEELAEALDAGLIGVRWPARGGTSDAWRDLMYAVYTAAVAIGHELEANELEVDDVWRFLLQRLFKGPLPETIDHFLSYYVFYDGHWFRIDHLHLDPDYEQGTPSAWFFGVGLGYDIARFLVFAPDEETALQIAEDNWPEWFFTEVDAGDMARMSEEELADLHEWTDEHGALHAGTQQEDIRVFTKATQIRRGRRVDEYSREVELEDGRIVESH